MAAETSRLAGRFLLRESLGASGVANLYSAHDSELDRSVTLKLIPRERVADSMIVRRWQREADALMSVRSSAVISYIDRLETDEALILVTEAQRGADLRSLLALQGSLGLENALGIALQIASGLHACHLAGVVHRDLRPENILVSDDGKVMLSNFAVAGVQDVTTLTMTGTIFGEPEYAAPESFQGADLDIRLDIYSLGIVLWEMLAGENPFEGEGIAEILHRKNNERLPQVSSLKPGVEPWLDELLARMTALLPEHRPPSLDPVIRSLERRQRLSSAARPSPGRCLACGYGSSEDLSFCPFCGRSGDPTEASEENEENVMCVVTNIGDPKSFRGFLHRTFARRPESDLAAASRKLPLPLVECTSAHESRWLVDSLEGLGSTAELRPAASWNFKLYSMLLMLGYTVCLLLAVNMQKFLVDYKPVVTGTGLFVCGLGRLLLVAACVMIVASYLRRSGVRLRRLPWLWWRGARPLGQPESDHDPLKQKLAALVALAMAALLFYMIGGPFLLAVGVFFGSQYLAKAGHKVSRLFRQARTALVNLLPAGWVTIATGLLRASRLILGRLPWLWGQGAKRSRGRGSGRGMGRPLLIALAAAVAVPLAFVVSRIAIGPLLLAAAMALVAWDLAGDDRAPGHLLRRVLASFASLSANITMLVALLTIVVCAAMLSHCGLVLVRIVELLVYYRQYGDDFIIPIKYIIGPLSTWLLIILAALLIIKFVVGKTYRQPLFGPRPATPGALSDGSDIRLLQRLRSLAGAAQQDNLRFILAETIESFVAFNRLRARLGSRAGVAVRDLGDRVVEAVETVLTTGETLFAIAEPVASQRTAMENKISRLRQAISNHQGPPAAHTRALLDEAEEELLDAETRRETMKLRLNSLRIVTGAISTATTQLLAISGAEPEPDVRRELSILSAALHALGTGA